MKIRNLFPALVALCSLVNGVEISCVATTATNTVQIQPFAVTAYTTNFTGNFNGPLPFNVGSQPQSVAAADVNGDGNVDLISANGDNDPGTLTVLTNDGSGNFVFSSTLIVSNDPAAVIAVDVNGDGKVDLVSASHFDNKLMVFTNNGDGTFTVASSPSVGSLPNSLASAVIDGSGKLSLISANEGVDNTLTVLTNLGGGIFVSNASYTVGEQPVCVVAADVNNDGKMDLISANESGNSLTVLTNNGSGVFGSNAVYTVGNSPSSVVAFTNVDGKVDLACVNYNDDTLIVLTNNGIGHFTIASTNNDPSISAPTSITAADVNGDGKMDLICANAGDYSDPSTLTVLTNDGSGGFVIASTPSVGVAPTSVVAADVNGDGGLDLIDADSYGGTLSVNYDSPTLNPIVVSGVAISWSTNSAFLPVVPILQQNTNLDNKTGWVNVGITPVVTNGLYQVAAPFSGGGQLFYRLLVHP